MAESKSNYDISNLYDVKNPEHFFEIFKKYVDEGGDIDATISVKDDSSKYYRPSTTLQRSIVFGHVAIMKYVLDNGADISKEICAAFGEIVEMNGNDRYHERD